MAVTSRRCNSGRRSSGVRAWRQRHTCDTRALERNVPLEVVQRQLGHADPRTTMRYVKPQLERLQAEMEGVQVDEVQRAYLTAATLQVLRNLVHGPLEWSLNQRLNI